jgi:hypothetical protein
MSYLLVDLPLAITVACADLGGELVRLGFKGEAERSRAGAGALGRGGAGRTGSVSALFPISMLVRMMLISAKVPEAGRPVLPSGPPAVCQAVSYLNRWVVIKLLVLLSVLVCY